MEEEQQQLREAIIAKLTRHAKSKALTKDHYDKLRGQTKLSRKTLSRFFKEGKTIGAQSRNILAAFYLDRLYDFKLSTEEGNEFFLEFQESLNVTDQLQEEMPKSETYTNWLGQEKLEFMVYEAAFLWHGAEPPGIDAHFEAMSRKIEETKMALHAAIENGELPICRQVIFPNGVTRWLSKADLREFAEKVNQRPEFLFGED